MPGFIISIVPTVYPENSGPSAAATSLRTCFEMTGKISPKHETLISMRI